MIWKVFVCFCLLISFVWAAAIFASPFAAIPIYFKVKEIKSNYTELHRRVTALEALENK